MAKFTDFTAKTSLDDTDILVGGESPFGSGDDFKVTFANLKTSAGIPSGGFADPTSNAQTPVGADSLIFNDASASAGSEAASCTITTFTSSIINPAADARIAAASVFDLSDVQDTSYTNGQVPVWSTANSRFEPGTGGGDDTEGWLDALSGMGALKSVRRNAANTDYETFTPADTTDLASAVTDAEDAAAVAVAAADEVTNYLPADYVRLSDTLTLDGSTNQYTAFKALVETAHTKKKVIIFDGLMAIDLSAGAITPGGPQEWVVEKDDYSQGMKVTGVVTSGDLVSILLTSSLKLSKNFLVTAATVTATNRTALPNGTAIFSIGASDITLQGKLVGVLNASTSATTGTGLSLAKAMVDADYERFSIRHAEIDDWWRVYFSDNGDEGERDDFSFIDLDIRNIGRDAIVVNAPGATAQNTDVMFHDIRLHNISMDADGSVSLGASTCRRVTFSKIGFSGYNSVGLSFEEMDVVQVSDIYGEVDHSRWASKTQAVMHVKANNISTGSYIANEQVQVNNVTVKQVGSLSGITNSNGIQFSGNSGASVNAVNDFDGNNITFEGFKRGIWDANEADGYSPLRFNRVAIRSGGVTGAGQYGVYSNQVNTEWKDITIGGYSVGVRTTNYSNIDGWTFINCSDTVVGADNIGTVVTNCTFVYTGQTTTFGAALVIKFLPVSRASAYAAVGCAFACDARSNAGTASATANYSLTYSSTGGITGNFPPASAITDDAPFNLGGSDDFIQVTGGRGGSGGSTMTLGPATESGSRGIYFEEDNITPTANAVLALKVEKNTSSSYSDVTVTIRQCAGNALLAAAAKINSYPS